jgi:hypothetical protein
VLRDREQGFETGLLLLGEQRGAGVEGAPRGIERVALAAAVPEGDLPSASTASFAVFHATPRPSATRATVKC